MSMPGSGKSRTIPCTTNTWNNSMQAGPLHPPKRRFWLSEPQRMCEQFKAGTPHKRGRSTARGTGAVSGEGAAVSSGGGSFSLWKPKIEGFHRDLASVSFFCCHPENYNMELFLFDMVCPFSNVFQHDQPDGMARAHICETRSHL